MKSMRKWMLQIGLLLLLPLVLALGWLNAPANAFTEEQKLVTEVWRIVSRSYLDESFNGQNWWFVRQRALRQPLRDREEAYSAIQAMLTSLDDPYTRLLKPDQYRSLQTNTSGELTGVGLQIAQDERGYLKVIAPIEGSPAAQAGILPKDRITQINGISTLNLSLDEAAERMRGRAGTKVTLTVEHEQAEPKDINLVRDHITLNPVYAELKTQPDGTKIGYIRLSQFNANATAEMMAALERLEAQDAAAYVLDLRNNPGGLLQAGIEIARLWLGDSTIVYTVNRQGLLDSFAASGDPMTSDPLVVLVNQGTASASEILAGALQDNERAKLVGESTFGKGLIQSLFNLSDGSGLAVTIAKYETPNHRDINRQGIQPDQVVPSDLIRRDQIATDEDAQYQAAVKLLTQPAVFAGVP